jgi:hypothetical protein
MCLVVKSGRQNFRLCSIGFALWKTPNKLWAVGGDWYGDSASLKLCLTVTIPEKINTSCPTYKSLPVLQCATAHDLGSSALYYLLNSSLELCKVMGETLIIGLHKRGLPLVLTTHSLNHSQNFCLSFLLWETIVLERERERITVIWFLYLDGDGSLPLPSLSRLWGFSLRMVWSAVPSVAAPDI